VSAALNRSAATRKLPVPQPQKTFLADVLAGLGSTPKRLPAKYFYDAAGSALFEEITRLPEYYPTRTELGILRDRGAEIAAAVPPGAALVEFGSGSSVKVRLLLEHLHDLAVHVPVDVSAEMLDTEAKALAADFPRLVVKPVAADFTSPFRLPAEAAGRPHVGFFPGSTIGNFEPQEAASFLRQAGEILGQGPSFIVGVDLVKDPAVLKAAYDDSAGVTARFNLNVLARINRELGGEFDLAQFAHRAFFNAGLSRVEMHLVSRIAQQVRIGSHLVDFEAGETIHTENSYKYTLDSFRALAQSAGWRPERVWTDRDNLFSVHLLTQA
jgi:L-histidine N-alpha-methyltransferase